MSGLLLPWNSTGAPQHAREFVAPERGVRNGCQTLPGDVIVDVQNSEPPAIGHLVMHEAEGPPGVCSGPHKQRGPGADSSLAAFALPDPNTFLAIEPVVPPSGEENRCKPLPRKFPAR